MDWLEEQKPTQTIGGERRDDRRYEMNLELKWKLIRRKKVVETGVGSTIDFSSGGVLFDAGRELVAGLNVELSIAWPVLLHNIAPMQLVVAGRIVRVHNTRSAVRMVQHEFRTVAVPPEHRKAMAAATRGALQWQAGNSKRLQ